MKRWSVTAKLMSPVAIKSNRQSDRSDSIRSITGTQVRGALANLYLQQHGEADDTFTALFLDEESCRYGPLDPGPATFPLTAASCKRERMLHALKDRLWFRIGQHHKPELDLRNEGRLWSRCPKCGADLKDHPGFGTWQEGSLCEAAGESRQVAAHVGIDRHTATAAEGVFYTLEAMMPSTRDADLHGWMLADDESMKALKELLQEEDHRISVGHHRTRGYGDVLLQVEDADDPEPHVEDWEQWSRNLIRFLGSPPFSLTEPNATDQFWFSLSFPAGAVLTDRFLRYSLDPADMIPWLPPMSPVESAFPVHRRPLRHWDSGGSIQWMAAVTHHELLRGWNAAHGLPRQDEWMVARGAVYVYCFHGTAEQRKPLTERLTALARNGTGLRRNEGFGMTIVSDGFHARYH